MWNRIDLKKRAKEKIKDTYWKCFLAVILSNVIISGVSNILFRNFNTESISIPENITREQIMYFQRVIIENWELVLLLSLWMLGLNLLINIFIINPMKVGQCRFFNENAREKTNIKDVFYAFTNGCKSYFNIVKTGFIKSLITGLWMTAGMAVIALIMFALGNVISRAAIMQDESTAVRLIMEVFAATILILIISIVAYIPAIVKMYQYYMVDYILADNPEISWREALKQSKFMMKGEKFKTFVLTLSFMGWLLLGSLFFGVGVYFVAPYINATDSELYLKLKEKLHDDSINK